MLDGSDVPQHWEMMVDGARELACAAPALHKQRCGSGMTLLQHEAEQLEWAPMLPGETVVEEPEWPLQPAEYCAMMEQSMQHGAYLEPAEPLHADRPLRGSTDLAASCADDIEVLLRAQSAPLSY